MRSWAWQPSVHGVHGREGLLFEPEGPLPFVGIVGGRYDDCLGEEECRGET